MALKKLLKFLLSVLSISVLVLLLSNVYDLQLANSQSQPGLKIPNIPRIELGRGANESSEERCVFDMSICLKGKQAMILLVHVPLFPLVSRPPPLVCHIQYFDRILFMPPPLKNTEI